MQFKSINVDGLNIFYREAGNEAAPKARPPARVSGFIAPRRKRGRLIGYAPGRAEHDQGIDVRLRSCWAGVLRLRAR